MKNRPVGAKLFHVDGENRQTDIHDEANILRTSVMFFFLLLYMVEKFLTTWVIIKPLRTDWRAAVN
jgi:hypothetical protein